MCSLLYRSDVNPNAPVGKIMIEQNCSYEEAYWKWFENRKMSVKRIEIVNNYVFGFDVMDRADEDYKHDHRQRYLVIPRTHEILQINHIIRIGKTSKKNTAISIDYSTFCRLRRTEYTCKMKGCFDRYSCLWYHTEDEHDEPWNKIPDDWVLGSEQCESFFNVKLNDTDNSDN